MPHTPLERLFLLVHFVYKEEIIVLLYSQYTVIMTVLWLVLFTRLSTYYSTRVMI